MLDRMLLSNERVRYGALIYGMALFDLLKKTMIH